MILAGDVGGTKTVLAICDDALAIVRDAVYRCADYPSFEAILDQFLAADEHRNLTAACIGVAGPVIDDAVKVTNLPWSVDARVLTAKLGGIPVALLNDLQATALGTLVIPDTAFAVLQPGTPVAGGTRAIIAPGTGLGEAFLVDIGGRYRALPTEGGHADFAPGNDEEIELLRFMRGRHGDHVSYERVLSGAGIGDLYDFVRTTAGRAEPAWLTQRIAGHDRNAVISTVALEGSDPSAMHALAMFTEILGAEAGNLALHCLATGGVVIGGGIPPKILPALRHPRLLERFHAKGRFSDWTRTIPLRVALEPRAALLGAAHHAQTHKDSRS